MSTEEENELTDISLCYQALGIPLDASPARVEQMYKSLTQECKKKLASSDPAAREEARRSLELIKEMYDKIKGSISYQAAAREHHKAAVASEKAQIRRDAPAKPISAGRTFSCPSCKSAVPNGLKVCPVCRSPLSRKGAIGRRGSSISAPLVAVIVAVMAAIAGAVVYFSR